MYKLDPIRELRVCVCFINGSQFLPLETDNESATAAKKEGKAGAGAGGGSRMQEEGAEGSSWRGSSIARTRPLAK